MKVRNMVRRYGPRIALAAGSLTAGASAFAVDPESPAAALGQLSGIATGFGPPLYGLAVASSIILIGIAWIKKGRGAAK